MNDNRIRVLIVEDNVALARVTQFAFENGGFHAETACDGENALEMALASPFDLILTDQQMPRMTGVELCRSLRATVEYAHTPIMMLTAKGLELELADLAAEVGVEVVFSKPFSPSEVVAKARELVASVF